MRSSLRVVIGSIVAVLSLLVTCLSLFGCSETQRTQQSDPVTTNENALCVAISQNATAETSIVNDTGFEIISLEVRIVPDGEFGKNLIPAASSWQDGELCLLKYSENAVSNSVASSSTASDTSLEASSSTASDTSSEASSSAGSDASSEASSSTGLEASSDAATGLASAQLKGLYELKLGLSNGKTVVLHDVAFTGIKESHLKLSGEFVYLEYSVDGKTISTLETEKELKKAADAKEAEEIRKAEEEKAAAEAKAAEEAQAAEAQAAAEAAAASAGSGYGYGYGDVSGSVLGGGSSEQSAESCLDGVVINQ
ncbi:MAG: hypothetical protein LBG97_10110 [Coriobacteriales bacterium]|jgi:hypothetical protein|nr:hypothetical protein [Coriobacteriales bacterium]